MAHIFACLLEFAEYGAPGATINNYSTALHHIFTTFTTNSEVQTVTKLGNAISIIAVITGYIFVGMFMGNFASLFENFDNQKVLYEEKKKNGMKYLRSTPRYLIRN